MWIDGKFYLKMNSTGTTSGFGAGEVQGVTVDNQDHSAGIILKFCHWVNSQLIQKFCYSMCGCFGGTGLFGS